MSIVIKPVTPATLTSTVAGTEPKSAPVAEIKPPDSPQAAPEQEPKKPEDARLDMYLKKEKQLRAMHKEIEAKKAELAAEKSRYETGYIDKSKLTSDPFGVLMENGLTYDKLTELLLNQPNTMDPTIRALKSEVQNLRTAQEQAQKRAEEQAITQRQQAVQQIRNDVKMLVDSDAEFETIKAIGMQDAVVELIEQTFDAENRVMDVSEAARAVEKHLVDEGLKYSQLNKIKARLQPTQASAATLQSQPSKTLTNASTATQAPRRMTPSEKRARAIAAFEGKLNQG